MYRLRKTTSFLFCLTYGRYLIRRLRRAGLTDMTDSVRTATKTVRTLGRAWEDASEPIQDALVDRDSADDDLDLAARNVRLALASRSRTATRESPYTDIFHKGMDYYVVAPLGEQVARYQELISRLNHYLSETDPVRVDLVPQLQSRLTDWSNGVTAVSEARNAAGLARTNLEAARDDWCALIEKVYGQLVAQVGKDRAERFFPRTEKSEQEPAAGNAGAETSATSSSTTATSPAAPASA